MNTFEHALDEIIALACDAGRLQAEAATAAMICSKPAARSARKNATEAERKLSAARTSLLTARRAQEGK